eukprot:scaffold267280_cov30-Tisochrysis_lutea.AAC.7
MHGRCKAIEADPKSVCAVIRLEQDAGAPRTQARGAYPQFDREFRSSSQPVQPGEDRATRCTFWAVEDDRPSRSRYEGSIDGGEVRAAAGVINNVGITIDANGQLVTKAHGRVGAGCRRGGKGREPLRDASVLLREWKST